MEQNNTSFAPVNTKSLLAFIFGQMSLRSAGKISTNEAIAQSKLASQANNLLNYELKRAIVEMRLHDMGMGIQGKEPKIREIESKKFE